jgi:predicted lipoprotein with Yx(FWY)xxD motif
MDVSRRTLLRTVAAGTALTAGCTGSSSSPSGGRMTTETPTASPTAATVQVRANPDLGDVLVGPEGMTLYMFDRDTQGAGSSTCADSCADTWPPLTVDGEPSAGGDVTVDLSTFEREDGSTQAVANGWPLYYFTPDEEPGDASGQGVNDVWWVLRPDGTPVRSTGTATAGADDTPTPTESGGRY